MELELGLGLKLECLEGVSKTLRGLAYFVPYLYGGRSPPYNHNTKYKSLPRTFDTTSSHSNFNSNSNPSLNSKFTKFNEMKFLKNLFPYELMTVGSSQGSKFLKNFGQNYCASRPFRNIFEPFWNTF